MGALFLCDLTVFSPEQRERLHGLVQRVFDACRDAEELPDGFRLGFPAGPDAREPARPEEGDAGASLALAITEWICLERLCCPCITFAIEFAPERGPIAVRMTGEPGIKPFLLAEFKGRIGDKLPR